VDDVVRVHANAMAAHGGPYDLTLDFGYRAVPTDEPEVQARVTMSWEHAAAVVKALQGMVDNYQQQVGPLPDLEHLRDQEEAR
jgi:hypothetical protein